MAGALAVELRGQVSEKRFPEKYVRRLLRRRSWRLPFTRLGADLLRPSVASNNRGPEDSTCVEPAYKASRGSGNCTHDLLLMRQTSCYCSIPHLLRLRSRSPEPGPFGPHCVPLLYEIIQTSQEAATPIQEILFHRRACSDERRSYAYRRPARSQRL